MNAEIPGIGLSNMNNKMPIFMLIKKHIILHSLILKF